MCYLFSNNICSKHLVETSSIFKGLARKITPVREGDVNSLYYIYYYYLSTYIGRYLLFLPMWAIPEQLFHSLVVIKLMTGISNSRIRNDSGNPTSAFHDITLELGAAPDITKIQI